MSNFKVQHSLLIIRYSWIELTNLGKKLLEFEKL
jgi:hypothetical protein